MQRGQIVILAVAGLLGVILTGCGDSSKTESGSAAQGVVDPCDGGGVDACTTCGTWVDGFVQAQTASFTVEMTEVCKEVVSDNTTDLATDTTSPASEQCLSAGLHHLSTMGERDGTVLKKQCIDGIKATVPVDLNNLVSVTAAFDAWKNKSEKGIVDSFVNETSGLLDNTAKDWGVEWVPVETPVTSASNTSETPARLADANMFHSKLSAQRGPGHWQKVHQDSHTNVIVGAGSVMLFSLAVMGVRKFKNQPARQTSSWLNEEESQELNVESGLE